MGQVLLGSGLVALALLVAIAVTTGTRRQRLGLAACALGLAAVLIVADNWQGARVTELREQPAIAAAALAVAGVATLLLARLFVRRPSLMVVLAVAVVPFRIPIELGGSSANLLLPLYLVLGAGVLAALLERRVCPRGPLQGRREAGGARLSPPEGGVDSPTRGPLALLGPALGVFVLIYALQALYADDLSAAVENVAFFFAPFAVLYLLVAAADWDRKLLATIAVVVVAQATLVAVVGFGQYATGELFWNDKVISGNEAHAWFRVNSLFFDPNIMGRFLALVLVGLAAALAFAREAPWPVRSPVGWVVLLILLGGLAISFSQSSMLALLGGLLVLVAAATGLPRAIVAGALTVAVLGAVAAGIGGGLSEQTSGRQGLVSGGLELAEERPLLGHGSGSFPAEFEQRFGGGEGIATVSHTEPVTVVAEQGAVGLVPYFSLLAVALAGLISAAGLGRGPATDPLAATVLAALAAMVVHSLGYAAFMIDPITWLLFGLASSALVAGASPAGSRRTRPGEPYRRPAATPDGG